MSRYIVTDTQLAKMLRAAYEDGWDDSSTVICEEARPRDPNNEDWEESVTFSNMKDDLKKADRSGGLL